MQNLHKNKCILLKKIIEESDTSLSKFAEIFLNYTGIKISRTGIFNLLNQGIMPKRIPDFKYHIEKIIKENFQQVLEKLNIKIEDIWNISKEMEETTMEKCEVLTNDAMAHFGVKVDPFMPVLTNENQVLMLQAHYYALENMRITAEMGLMTAITGQVGSGKTTVLAKFKRTINKQDKYIIIQPKTREIGRITTREILEAILNKLSDDKPKRNLEALSRQVEELLQKTANSGKRCILIIEESQDLHTNTIKKLKRLWEIGEDEFNPLLAIILIGQTELAYKLYGSQNMNLREVASRMTHVELGAINHELYDYIKHKCKMAGLQVEKIITKDAVDTLSARFISKDVNGKVTNIAYPNKVNNVMKLLMNTAAAAGEEIINNEVIEMAGI